MLGSTSKQEAEHLTTQGKKTSNKQKFKGKKKKKSKIKALKEALFLSGKKTKTKTPLVREHMLHVLKCFKSHNASGFLGEAVDLGKEEKLHCELHED